MPTPQPSSAVLYRRLIKGYIKKFDTDHETIIKAWRLTKGEFYKNRLIVDPVAITAAKKIAVDIIGTVKGGIIPIYQHKDTPTKTYYKVTKDVLDESEGNVDPVTGEEFVRKYKDYISKEDLATVETELRASGRWKGGEIQPTRTGTIKIKVMAKDI